MNKECQGTGGTQCSHGRCRFSVAGVFEFEIVAGRVKYSGPNSPRTTRLPPKFQTHRLELPPELAGRRLDQALALLLPQYSRTRIQRWIEEGAVLVNGLGPARATSWSVASPRRSRRACRRRPASRPRSCRSTSSTRTPRSSSSTSRPAWWCIPAPAIASTRCRTRCWRTTRSSSACRAPGSCIASTRTPAGC